MGKKNNKIEYDTKLSSEELVPATIGILEEDKKSSIMLIVFFTIFLAFALFLPTISSYVTNLLDKDNQNIVTSSEDKNESKEENVNEKEEIEIFDYSEELVINVNDLKFDNFYIYNSNSKYYLNFDVTNNTNSYVDFSSEKYYIEIYDSNSTFINRHIFKQYNLASDAKITQSIELTDVEHSNIAKVLIVKKLEKDYPITELEQVDGKYSLICKNNNETITYVFNKKKVLTNINDYINVTNDNSAEYTLSLNKYTNQVTSYNNKDGVSSNIIEIISGFTVNTEIDLAEANIDYLDNEYYYDKKVEIKTIDYEMEARGFSCN